jgi:hypothetical protein
MGATSREAGLAPALRDASLPSRARCARSPVPSDAGTAYRPPVVEYGGGISHGPAGQVGGGGVGSVDPSGGGGHVDVLASISHTFNDLTHAILAQPPEVLAVGIVLVFLGLIVLRRAF